VLLRLADGQTMGMQYFVAGSYSACRRSRAAPSGEHNTENTIPQLGAFNNSMILTEFDKSRHRQALEVMVTHPI
jgi:hypothetical protein